MILWQATRTYTKATKGLGDEVSKEGNQDHGVKD